MQHLHCPDCCCASHLVDFTPLGVGINGKGKWCSHEWTGKIQMHTLPGLAGPGLAGPWPQLWRCCRWCLLCLLAALTQLSHSSISPSNPGQATRNTHCQGALFPYIRICILASLNINGCVLFKNRDRYELKVSSLFYLYLIIIISWLLSHV